MRVKNKEAMTENIVCQAFAACFLLSGRSLLFMCVEQTLNFTVETGIFGDLSLSGCSSSSPVFISVSVVLKEEELLHVMVYILSGGM